MFSKKKEENNKPEKERIKEVEMLDKENPQDETSGWKKKIFSCSFAIF
jgi:hypothetical protein